MNLTCALNTAWMWKARGQWIRFRRATCDVAYTQAVVLKEIVSRNRATEFGIRHGFRDIRSPREFQNRVPLSTYDDYAAAIRQIADGKKNVLTSERVRLLEPTSGTTSGEKLIPYTRSLHRQFQLAVAAWIADLMQHRPAIRRGRAYWSISPALGKSRRTSSGIPIGFDDDTAYLGRLERFVSGKLLVVPPDIVKLTNLENFRYCTLLHLLQANDLSLISVWSPTFLTTLLAGWENQTERICYDLRKGSLSLPCREDSNPNKKLRLNVRKNIGRAEQLAAILHSGCSLPESLQQVWPQLELISCWTDAAAAEYVPEIRRLFPAVEIQPKGLIATEGCVTFPLIGCDGAALALRSHFFEFEEVEEASHEPADSNKIRLAHELSAGDTYRVVLTTAGGLYRYQLRDLVKVVGFENECPLLRFLGKTDRTSDLVGEKLGEPHIREALQRVFSSLGISPSFSLVVPVSGRPPRYRLYLQGDEIAGRNSLQDAIASALQKELEANPYYRHAVLMRQLSRLEVCILEDSAKPGWLIYEQGCLARGQKAGDIKPAVLDSRSGWEQEFSRYANSTVLD